MQVRIYPELQSSIGLKRVCYNSYVPATVKLPVEINFKQASFLLKSVRTRTLYCTTPLVSNKHEIGNTTFPQFLEKIANHPFKL